MDTPPLGTSLPGALRSYQLAWGRARLFMEPLCLTFRPWEAGLSPPGAQELPPADPYQTGQDLPPLEPRELSEEAPSSRWDPLSSPPSALKLYVSADLGKKWTLLQERVTKDHVFW